MLLKEMESEGRNETHTPTREPWHQDANGGGRGTYGWSILSLTRIIDLFKNMEVLEIDKEIIQ